MYITGRIYNRDYTEYRRFNTIVSFCIDDVYMNAFENAYYEKYEDYDSDTYSKFEEEFDRKHKYEVSDKQIKEYADELFYCSQGEYIKSYDDYKEFYQMCNESIHKYNDWLRRRAA